MKKGVAARRIATVLGCMAVLVLFGTGAPAASGRNTAYKRPHPGWKVHTTEHFAFYYAPDSTSAKPGGIEKYAAHREEVRATICEYLQINHRKTIHFFVYDNNEVAKRIIGRVAGFARSTDAIIHSRINQTPGHEMTHVLSRAINGRPPPHRLLDEGLAVFMDHSGRDYFRIAGDLLEAGKLPSFKKMLPAFSPGREKWYHPAGAYVGFLCECYGIEAFKRLWGARPQNFYTVFERTYGVTAAEMDKRWRKFLRARMQPVRWEARGWSGKLWDKDISGELDIQAVGDDLWRMRSNYGGWNHSRVFVEARDVRDGPVTFAVKSSRGCTVGVCSASGGDANVYVVLAPSPDWQKIRLAIRKGRHVAEVDGSSVPLKSYFSANDIYRPFIAIAKGVSLEVKWVQRATVSGK